MDQRPDRRKESRGGRRFRDRLLERGGTENPALADRHLLANQLLLIDDDLRQTALALGSVEQFLSRALALLDDPQLTAADLAALAGDGDALDKLDELSETVQSLRRRLLAVASNLR